MNPSRIHALPLHLANQIAAGEVVERPASVLKELVENSIDAGASQIDIVVEGAGSQLIKVTDNGLGIHPDDLALALSRHATSKINSSEQLSHIDSLGFRGEALPSIASVSRLTLTSKQPEQDCGWKVTGEQVSAAPAAHPDGTSVEVAELFFNLPARRRFLRSDKTETQHLLTTLNRLALSRFDVGFSLRLDDHNAISLPAIKTAALNHQRIAKICGQSFVRETRYLEQQFEDIKLHGWVGSPSAHRAQTDIQYFFINGRVIRDRIITHAIRQAYGDSLPAGRQAAFVLYLSMPLDRVDVNVHPTKHEVRFRDARLVHGLITRAVEEALANPFSPTQQSELPLTPDAKAKVEETAARYHSTPAVPASYRSPVAIDNKAYEIATSELSLIHQRYVLVTAPEVAIIDLKQAEQELRQHQFMAAIEDNSLTSRPILVPLTVPADQRDRQLIEQHQALLSEFAIELTETNSGLTVRRIPFLLSQVDLAELVSTIIEALSQSDSPRQQLADSLIKLIPEKTISSQEQAKAILAELPENKLTASRWYRKLDPAALSGLFSDYR